MYLKEDNFTTFTLSRIGESVETRMRVNTSLAQIENRLVTEAVGGMVIDHAHGLHMSIAYCRTHEPETALNQVLTHFSRDVRLGWDFMS